MIWVEGVQITMTARTNERDVGLDEMMSLIVRRTGVSRLLINMRCIDSKTEPDGTYSITAVADLLIPMVEVK